MASRFRVLLVGKPKERWAQQAVDDYARRLRRHGGVDEAIIKPEKYRGDVHAVRQAEGRRMLASVRPSDRLVVLDERGEGLDTAGFQELVDEGRQLGPLVFAVGGAYGHDPSVRAAAWRCVRLSDLVLNHEVARVVLYEQLYRAMTLIAGVPYHH